MFDGLKEKLEGFTSDYLEIANQRLTDVQQSKWEDS